MVRELGDLEKQVMDRMWSWDRPVAVREILADLRPERDLAYTTIMTVMDNLHRKGVLTREKDGRAYLYRPVLSREAHTAAFMGEVLAGANDRTMTLRRFVEQMPSEDAARLRAALDEHLQDSEDAAR